MNNKVKFIRTEADLSIRELADLIDMNFSMLNRIELNNVKGLKESTIIKFCNFFQVEPNYLLGFSNTGILCKNSQGIEYSLSEKEYLTLAEKLEISFDFHNESRIISRNGEITLGEMRSKEFDQSLLQIIQIICSKNVGKEIVELLPRLNDKQLDFILTSIKTLLGQ